MIWLTKDLIMLGLEKYKIEAVDEGRWKEVCDAIMDLNDIWS